MQFLHVVQLLHSKRVQKYDYGKKRNMLKYGQEKPPLYNLGNFKLPIYMFYGKHDVFIKEHVMNNTWRFRPYKIFL